MGILSWLENETRADRAPRYPGGGIVASYWAGGTPRPRAVKDLSVTGAFLCDTDRWQIGTLIASTLRIPAEWGNEFGTNLTISFIVIRSNAEGMGVRFLPENRETRKRLQAVVNCLAERSRTLPANDQQSGG